LQVRLAVQLMLMPMPIVDHAASTTSSVMVPSSLIFMMRSIWVKSLSTRRKFPRVMRAMAAMACASGKSSGSSAPEFLPSALQDEVQFFLSEQG
jgi:hypothetical protein